MVENFINVFFHTNELETYMSTCSEYAECHVWHCVCGFTFIVI